MERFHGKVVLISGGARGQGAAEARMLVAEGAKVVIGDLRVPRSLDPGIVPDPWVERGVRLRRYRLLGMLGRLALAGSAAAIVALLAVGKLSVPATTGATEQADTSPSCPVFGDSRLVCNAQSFECPRPRQQKIAFLFPMLSSFYAILMQRN